MPTWMQNLLENGVVMPFPMMSEGGGEGGGGGGAPAGGGEGGGDPGAATPPAGGGDPGSSGGFDFMGMLGEEYSGNENFTKFAKNENPLQDMAKSYLELQSQLGKPKIGVPGDEASDEAKAQFWADLGVPETPEGYGFKKPESLPEGFDYSEEHAAKWAGIFKEHNVPGPVANAIREAFFAEIGEGAAAQGTATKEANEALDKVYTEQFGDKKQEIVQRVKADMQKVVTDEKLREALASTLPNEALLYIGMMDNYYRQQFGQGDQNIGDGAGSGAGDVNGLRDQAQKLMASEAYRDPMHKDHKTTRDRVDQMYRDIGQLTKQAQKQ